MFRIGRNFHIIHMTDDLPALDAWYDDVFSVTRFMDQQYSDVLIRDASLVLIGDLCIEPMAPAFGTEGWDRVAIGRFFKRFGSRWHSIAWYTESAAELPELYDALVGAGVRMFDGRGARTTEAEPSEALFTHPRDTVTQLEFLSAPSDELRRILADPRFEAGFDPAPWTVEHPLHITKSSHVTLAVRDLAKACDLYVGTLNGTLLHEADVPLTMTRSAFVAVGTDLVIELAQPLDEGSPLALDMARHGPNLFAVTLQVRDLDAAERHLEARGVRFAERDATTLLTDPASTHGTMFGFTTASIPNDTRPAWG